MVQARISKKKYIISQKTRTTDQKKRSTNIKISHKKMLNSLKSKYLSKRKKNIKNNKVNKVKKNTHKGGGFFELFKVKNSSNNLVNVPDYSLKKKKDDSKKLDGGMLAAFTSNPSAENKSEEKTIYTITGKIDSFSDYKFESMSINDAKLVDQISPIPQSDVMSDVFLEDFNKEPSKSKRFKNALLQTMMILCTNGSIEDAKNINIMLSQKYGYQPLKAALLLCSKIEYKKNVVNDSTDIGDQNSNEVNCTDNFSMIVVDDREKGIDLDFNLIFPMRTSSTENELIIFLQKNAGRTIIRDKCSKSSDMMIDSVTINSIDNIFEKRSFVNPTTLEDTYNKLTYKFTQCQEELYNVSPDTNSEPREGAPELRKDAYESQVVASGSPDTSSGSEDVVPGSPEGASELRKDSDVAIGPQVAAFEPQVVAPKPVATESQVAASQSNTQGSQDVNSELTEGAQLQTVVRHDEGNAQGLVLGQQAPINYPNGNSDPTNLIDRLDKK